MATPAPAETLDLAARFPGAVTPDTRPGYSGWVVTPERLLEFARFVRDELGYDYLVNLCAVDYLPEDRMEVVYNVFKTTGDSGLTFKTRAPAQRPHRNSLGRLHLAGRRFPGARSLGPVRRQIHRASRPAPDSDVGRLRRPPPCARTGRKPSTMKKSKPFKRRWPDGKHVYAEKRSAYGDNVYFKPGFDPEKWTPTDPEEALYKSLKKYKSETTDGIETDHIIVNMGPQHPSTHGVFRAVVVLDGETVVSLKPVMGYLHRNHEKIGERNTWLQNMPYTDRLDYFNSMTNNWGYALAVEKLMGIPVAERAEYIRVIMAELSRIQNHLILIGMLLNDLGAYFTPALYAFEERETDSGRVRGRLWLAHDVQLLPLWRGGARY